MIIFSIILLLIALAGMFWFGGSKVFCILLLIAALAGVVLCLLPQKKLRSIPIALVPLCLVLCLFAGQSAAEGGAAQYRNQIREAVAQIDKGNPDKGIELLDELDEEFGVTDLSLYGRVEAYLFIGDYKTALSYAGSVKDKANEYWYKYMEKILCAQGATDTTGIYDARTELENLYLDAAEELPESGYMQYMAGLVKLGRGSYQGAASYFRNARRLEAGNPLPCYYLGVICYEQGRKEDAIAYFSEALELGLDEEKAANVSWYME